MSNRDELVTAEEAMRLLGVKRTKLYQLINSGQLPRANVSPVRQRQELTFWRSDIERLLNPKTQAA